MATKLKKMHLTSVDMVRAGANQKADICLYKSADAPDPAEEKPNILKRLMSWLEDNVTEADLKDDPIEKAADEPEEPIEEDPAELYRDAITKSLQSIVEDDTLDKDAKNDMIAKSIGQYHEKMVELAKSAYGYEEEPEPDEPYEDEPPMSKSDRYDEIEEIV